MPNLEKVQASVDTTNEVERILLSWLAGLARRKEPVFLRTSLNWPIVAFFTVFLGVELIHSGQLGQLVRTDDSYYSLFQLGLIYLDHLLNECLEFPTFKLRPPDSFNYLSFV